MIHAEFLISGGVCGTSPSSQHILRLAATVGWRHLKIGATPQENQRITKKDPAGVAKATRDENDHY